MKFAVFCGFTGMVSLLASAAPDPRAVISRPLNPGTNNALFTSYNWQSFRKVPKANEPINPQNIDVVLLDAAVFHETNRRRLELKLPALGFAPLARQMANLQTHAMAEQGFVGHENLAEPQKKTMTDRARLAGLKFSSIAENVASTFGRRYKSGANFYSREENGVKIFSYAPHGPEIPMHTAVSFAEALVDAWMNSPPHRKNILLTNSKFLGCSCEQGKQSGEMMTFYGTQIFFAP
ncbi:MAG TPA: CAP domain-containing protein [Candidatus Saccharimonadales bacterium]|nr:CAP domain-containing protein [Candidatus Saccharimonadales bacterium]